MNIRKKKFLKRKCKGPYVASVDNLYRKDWLNMTRIIGDKYFSVDI